MYKVSTSESENVAFFDMAVAICPQCGIPLVESGWYGIDMESDIGCYGCGENFNFKKHAVDRATLSVTLSKNGKIKRLGVEEKTELE